MLTASYSLLQLREQLKDYSYNGYMYTLYLVATFCHIYSLHSRTHAFYLKPVKSKL